MGNAFRKLDVSLKEDFLVLWNGTGKPEILINVFAISYHNFLLEEMIVPGLLDYRFPVYLICFLHPYYWNETKLAIARDVRWLYGRCYLFQVLLWAIFQNNAWWWLVIKTLRKSFKLVLRING